MKTLTAEATPTWLESNLASVKVNLIVIDTLIVDIPRRNFRKY